MTAEQQAKRRYQTVTCTRCGNVRNRGGITMAERESFVCGVCLRKDNKKAAPKPTNRCLFCDKLCMGTYCDKDCYGGVTAAGERLGLSRQRMSQLVAAQVAAHGGTRKRACEAIIAARAG